jgi:NADPH oxidase
LIIVATTFDFVRRNYFNAFFFAHYSFVGFFVLGCLHAPQARPFIFAGVGLYVLDKLLVAVWTVLPHRTLECRPRGEDMAQVSAAKTINEELRHQKRFNKKQKARNQRVPIPFNFFGVNLQVRFPKCECAKLTASYKVGQYVFINFPELSLHEWHPFSVSSAPWEPFLEVNIRALGDHTRDINALAKACASEQRQTWVRVNGPYGFKNFDFRRYGTLVLVGGGVGITPVLGIMKELYGGYASGERSAIPAHCLARVLCVWVVPTVAEAEAFRGDFAKLALAAASDPQLPKLDLRIHLTRAKAQPNTTGGAIVETSVETSVETTAAAPKPMADLPPLLSMRFGRPDVPRLLEDAGVGDRKLPALVFACVEHTCFYARSLDHLRCCFYVF